MEKVVLNVNGMTCSHCEKAVTNAVSALAGVSKVVVDLAAKTVTVEYQAGLSEPADFKLAIEDQGYDVE
jgi:copper chaperone